ncbi:MAG: histidine kinase N-terminal 7TM domain-containing protein [Candidatus Methanofastidiosia archaeon]|jgi:PAS domain S-box-containing protein
MILEEIPYTLLALLTAGTLMLSACYISKRSQVPGVKAAALLMFLAGIYMTAYTMEIGSSTLLIKIIGDKMQFSVVSIMPVVWVLYASRFTGQDQWVTRRNVALLAIVPVILMILAITNEFHHIIWSRVALSTDKASLELDKAYNIGYWVFVLYSYILIPFGSVLLIRTLFRGQFLHYQQGRTLLFAVFLPLVGSTLYLIGAIPSIHPSSTLFFPVVITLILAYIFVGWRIADIVPTAWGAVVHSINDSVIVLDNQNRIMDLNPAAQTLVGGSPSELIGTPIDKAWPMVDVVKLEKTNEVVINGEEQHIYDVGISPVNDWRGLITSRVIVARDITERKKAEKQIKASLKEKEVLLREIHHRVKNNLQIISSLLNLQSRYMKDTQYANMLKESQDRIKSMALIHETLYQSKDLANINFEGYIHALVRDLARSYGVLEDEISINIKVDDVSLAVDTAIPVGLIINELVSNSLKHAFPHRKGEIIIGLRSVNGDIELEVSDNGVGMPGNIDFRNTKTLGLHLVTILAEDQLDGDITLDRNNGTKFYIRFKHDI